MKTEITVIIQKYVIPGQKTVLCSVDFTSVGSGGSTHNTGTAVSICPSTELTISGRYTNISEIPVFKAEK